MKPKINPEWLTAPLDVAFATPTGPSVKSQMKAATKLRKNPAWEEAQMEMVCGGTPEFIQSMREFVDRVNRKFRL